MVYQHISNLVHILTQHGIDTFFLSPGSRSAPLTLSAARHPLAKTYIFYDERACGYAALGYARQTKRATAIISTSGTAAINLFPAVAEAYFSEIPLLVITADRPPEWIAQQDGQAIFQEKLFGKHSKDSWQLPVLPLSIDEQEFITRIANMAVLVAEAIPKGPVHINVPLREPLYPEAGEQIVFQHQRIIVQEPYVVATPKNVILTLVKKWLSTDRKLIIVGQHDFDKDLNNALYACHYYLNTPILSDITANLSGCAQKMIHHDLLLRHIHKFRDLLPPPELIITIGKGILSKNLKKYLRSNKPQEHWHLQEAGSVADVFNSLTKIIRHSPSEFITKIGETGYFEQNNGVGNDFNHRWLMLENELNDLVTATAAEAPHSDFAVVHQFIKSLPEKCIVHLANSMPVRYANLFAHGLKEGIEIYANRGTSGIDGCTSSALGAALATDLPVFLLTGDVAALYDRNALWMSKLPNNLKIIILNNSGGNIFSMIDGPSSQPELHTHFEGEHSLNFKNAAADYMLDYFSASTSHEFSARLIDFFRHPQSAVFEVFTDKKTNKEVMNALHKKVESYIKLRLAAIS